MAGLSGAGKPGDIIAQGNRWTAAPPDTLPAAIRNTYLQFNLVGGASLIADTLYWAAVGHQATEVVGGAPPFVFQLVQHQDYGSATGVVLFQDNGIVPATLPLTANAINTNQIPYWFRIYDPSSSFIVGPQGVTGPTGHIGKGGPTGPCCTGATGLQGPTGDAGPAGANGVDGVDGATGLQGPTGAAGANGVDGVDGATGLQGPTGAAGPAGANGVDGSTGPTGPCCTGPTGTQGTNGTNGTNGIYGPPGGYVTSYKGSEVNQASFNTGNINRVMTSNTTTLAGNGDFRFSSEGQTWPGVINVDYQISNTVYSSFKTACDNQGDGEIFFRIFEAQQPNEVNYYKFDYNKVTIIGVAPNNGMLIENVSYIGGNSMVNFINPIIGWGMPGSGGLGVNTIPYEPWNMNILDQTSAISALQTFFIHFIAPFSGVYTKAKMLTSPTSVTGTVNYLGMAIYSNTPYTTVISGTPANGRPNAPVTQGSIQGLSLTSPNLFLEVPLAPAFSLVEGESYWFAFAWDRNGPPVSANIFADYSAYNTAANCILKANGLYTGNISPSFAVVVAGNLQQADESCWFRLS